jgi:integrase
MFSGFKTKTDAKKALTSMEEQVNTGTYRDSTPVTFSEHIEKWFIVKRKALRSQTAKVYEQFLRDYILPYFSSKSKLTLQSLRTEYIDDFIDHMTKVKRKDGKVGYSYKTIKKCHEIIGTCLEKALDDDLILKNHAKKATLPKHVKKELVVWNQEEINQFLKHAEGNPLYPLFLLALNSGCRQGELLGLRWKDLDFEKNTLSVRQVLSHDERNIAWSKNCSRKQNYRVV